MANLNKVLLIGRLTADPELRRTPSGTAVVDVRMAVDHFRKSAQGERQKETCFLDVTFWARQAETICQYMEKGRQLFVEGRLRLDTWETPEGKKRSRLRVVGENFQFIDSRRGGGDYPDADPPPRRGRSQPAPRRQEPSPPQEQEEDGWGAQEPPGEYDDYAKDGGVDDGVPF